MPIYDYVCGTCRHRFEVFHGLNESGPHQCPECGGAVSRAFAPPTIVFKGSGWAKVDRRATSSPAKTKPSRSSEPSGGEGGEAKASSPAAPGPAASPAPSGGPDA